MTTQDRIQAAGGIVFTDGNITFSSVEQFLAAAQVPAGWQPIATAPKSGTSVLVAVSKIVGEANFDDDDASADGNWYWAQEHWTDHNARAIYPTHWMPLPAAPDAAHNITPATGTQEAKS